MLFCKKCGVSVRTNHKRCPLCQGDLTGEWNEEEVFPIIQEKEYVSKKVIQWFNFLCIAAAVICFMINWLFTPDSLWCLFAIAGIACVWIFLAVGLYKRKNLMKNVMWQLVLLTIGSIIWDLITGFYGWSIDYVFPIICMISVATMVSIVMIRKLLPEEYMIYYLMAAGYGLLPFIFVLTGLCKNTVVSIVCVGSCSIFLASLVVFQGKFVKEELRKKLHV